MRAFKRIWVIRNPVAGWDSQKRTQELISELAARAVAFDVIDTMYAGHAQELASDACQKEVDLLIVCGGDGTLNEIINGIMPFTYRENDRIPVIAIYPAGTANLVAKELKMPDNPVAFVDVLFANHMQEVWPAKVNNKYFIATVGIGFDAYIVGGVSKQLKKNFSRWAYVLQTFILLIHSWKRRYLVLADSQEYHASALIIVKSRYYAGKYVVTPHVTLAAPDLYVCIFECYDRWTIFTYIISLLRNQLYNHKDVRIISVGKIEITGAKEEKIQIDGDVSLELPVLISKGETAVYMLRN